MTRRDAPATHRNREPIAEVLESWLEGPTRVLEIASGTGQHAVYLAGRLPHLSWQPSDADPEALESISSWRREAGPGNVAEPVALDAAAGSWPVDEVDAIFCANLIHIAPWRVAEGLFAGAGRLLGEGGLLLIYGPFRIGGEHTAPSNAAFDESLRARDPAWGVRALEAVEALAEREGLALVRRHEMPANNQLLVFRALGRDRV